MIRALVILVLFFLGLPSFCGGCDNWKQGIYPEQLLKEYSREYLNEYCSASKESQGDFVINQYGQFPDVSVKKGEPGSLNSKYRPETIIYPFRTKEQQALADYYDTLPKK